MEHVLDAIDQMGDEPGEPWASFRDAAEVLDDLAEALEDTEIARATELINQFEQAFPGTAFALYHLGMVARLEGREDDALKLYREAATKTTKVPALWNNVGILLAMRGERDEAIAAFKRVLEINPRDATALESLAQLRAIVRVQRDPKDPATVSYIDIPTYGKHMVQQLNAVGDKPEELLKIGGQLLNDGLVPELGFQAVERAAKLQPDDPRALMALASAYSMGGKKDEARATLTRYTELFPQDPRGFFSLAQLCSEDENDDAELAALEKVLELDPNAQPAIAIYFDLSPTEHDPEKEQALTEFAAEQTPGWRSCSRATSPAAAATAKTALKWAERAYDVAPDPRKCCSNTPPPSARHATSRSSRASSSRRSRSGKFSKRLDWAYAQVLHQLGLPRMPSRVLRKAATSEDVPEEFKQQAVTVIDAWNGVHRLRRATRGSSDRLSHPPRRSHPRRRRRRSGPPGGRTAARQRLIPLARYRLRGSRFPPAGPEAPPRAPPARSAPLSSAISAGRRLRTHDRRVPAHRASATAPSISAPRRMAASSASAGCLPPAPSEPPLTSALTRFKLPRPFPQ